MVSCNYFFYETGTRQGIDNIVKYSEQLGLGVESGIELSEATGHVSSPEYYESAREGQTDSTWTYGNVLQSAIGQLDNAYTPLQMANYTATLANNGTRMRSHLVKSIESYNRDTRLCALLLCRLPHHRCGQDRNAAGFGRRAGRDLHRLCPGGRPGNRGGGCGGKRLQRPARCAGCAGCL